MARKQNTKAKYETGATLGFEEKLWAAADKMRSYMDPAEYKHVVLAYTISERDTNISSSKRTGSPSRRRQSMIDLASTPTKAKLTSMLMLGHLIATSGNLLKARVIFGMNPLAVNWAQMLALPPVTLAWISQTLKRNRSIRNKLDEEWISTYQTMLGSLA